MRENIIRRKWLIAFYAYAFWIFLYYGCYYGLALAHCQNERGTAFLVGFLFIILTGMLLMPYYFGYKKKGTGILAWVTIVGGLTFISKTPEIISEINDFFIEFGLTNSIINYCYVLQISGIFLGAYYLINSGKLYSVNKAIKYSNNKDSEKIAKLSESGENHADV